MLTTLMLALSMQTVPAPQAPPLAPGTRYDPQIPTLTQVVGHDVAEEISTPEEIVLYVKALAAAAPDRTRLVEYARSWEGRPLYVLAIGSPDRISAIERVRTGLQRLADPRTAAAGEIDRLLKELPVVVWLMHGVHGNEISSCDAALAEAYHLLAAQGDAAVDAIRREAIVLIDPSANPDGRARFIFQNLQGRAATPDPEPASAEHDEPWPGGRANHYLFDMNRDWFSQSQPETRGRTKMFLEWFPQVVVDLHEMGGDGTYYFAPPADPINPQISKQQVRWLETFGRANAKAFDARGFAYFIREVYDTFYPGYGDSWPTLQGAIGMTHEQASARGLLFRRRDETMLRYRDGVLHHFTSAIVTAETSARNREAILRDFVDYRRSAIQEGERGPVREYVLVPGADPARAAMLARLLASQGFEIRRAEQAIKAGSRDVPAGAYVVPAAQPGGHLLRNLLDPQTPQPEPFVKEQDRRRQKRLGDQIYDVTGWSLPLAFDVEVVTLDRPSGAKSSVLSSTTEDGHQSAPPASALAAALPRATVGYLLPWGSGTSTAIVEALQAGIRVRMIDRPFALSGRKYAGGVALVRAAENGADLAAKLGAIVTRQGIEAVAIDSAFVDEGISLGSNQVAALKAPRVLLAWDAPTQSVSAGWARYVLERRFMQPVTAVRVSSLARVDLHEYDVLILPAGNYGTAISGDALRRLKDWINAGGTLVTLGEASRWAARENVGLLDTRTQLRDGRPELEPSDRDQKKDEAPPPKPFDLEKAIQPDRERPDLTPGSLLRVTLDPEHWLAAGTDGEIQVMVEGQRVFAPIKLDKGRNVGVYTPKDRLVASGLVWPEAQALLAQKAFLLHQPTGQGHVIAFAEDPNYRGFTEATELLFINAVLFGPAK